MASIQGHTHVNTVVIGGGQAGLSVGYHLKRHGVDFVVLDDRARVGDVWRSRWDSLRLFTPARHAGLDGLPFPAPPFSFPT
jgi:putative flavoprotein involved in K+ transport